MTINFLIVGSALELVGGLLIAVVVWGVHSHILEEGRIDEAVFKTMRRERVYVYLGMALLLSGFFCELYAYMRPDSLL